MLYEVSQEGYNEQQFIVGSIVTSNSKIELIMTTTTTTMIIMMMMMVTVMTTTTMVVMLLLLLLMMMLLLLLLLLLLLMMMMQTNLVGRVAHGLEPEQSARMQIQLHGGRWPLKQTAHGLNTRYTVRDTRHTQLAEISAEVK